MSDSAKEAARKAWAEQMLERADSEGSVELSGGVWLHSQEDVIAEQEDWPEEDAAKDMDFTDAPYWITTDNGHTDAVFEAEDIPAHIWEEREQGKASEREAVRPEPAKSAADYKTLNAVWGRDMSPDAMNERACAWADQDKPYRDAMEPAALDRRAKAQDEWEREHTHSNPFGGQAIKAETDEKSPMDELRDLRQEHEDGLKVLREDADFLNAAVKGHREYSLVYTTLADRGGVLDATKLAERTEASRAHDPAVQDMLAKTEPVRERSDEGGRSDDGSAGSGGSGGVVRSDDHDGTGGGGGMAKPALRKSLAAATGR